MSRHSKRSHRETSLLVLSSTAVVVVTALLVGCQDGPMYALKAANPYYTRQWKQDQEIGVTDHERRVQLTKLADTIGKMPASRQQFWAQHLEKMIENDESPEMRTLAIKAAGNLRDATALTLIEKGLDDESLKVRIEACESLGRRSGDEAARMLAATIGTETNDDVRHAAMIALSNHNSPIAVDSLRIALSDRNPATRSLAVESLREATGKNYGDDPEVWIAALDGTPTAEQDSGITDRLRNFF